MDLKKRFGRLVAAHRRRLGLTQHDLAEAADLSDDMIAQIETGTTGARFPSIERLAAALKVDPAELFTTDLPKGSGSRPVLTQLTTRLARLSDNDLAWLEEVIEVALSRPRKPDHR